MSLHKRILMVLLLSSFVLALRSTTATGDSIEKDTGGGILEKRIEKCTKAYKLAFEGYQKGQASAEDVYVWSRRVMENKNLTCKTKKDRIETIQEHQKRLRDLARFVNDKAVHRPQMGGQLEKAYLEYYMVEAESLKFQAEH